MGKKRYSKAFEIALSGIACAAASGALALGILSGYLVATGYIFGILALMVPISKGYYVGDFLAHIGTCILAVALGAASQFWSLVPFAMFFGLHPLVNALQLKFNINRWIALVIKALWFDATLVVAYLLVFEGVLGGEFLPEQFYAVLNDYIYVFIFTLGTAFFIIYYWFIIRCQKTVNLVVQRIIK